MRVLWITFIPSPYRLRFFEELGKECKLTVLFERANSKNRQSHWDDFTFNGYEGIILHGLTIGGFDKFCPGVAKYLNHDYDIIVISNPTSPTGIYAAGLLQLKNIPYIVESDGAFPTHGKGVKMQLKKYVMGKASLCFSSAKLHDEYYMECGVRPKNIRRYPFTSIGMEDISKAKKLTGSDKKCFKERIGLTEQYMILSVGRFSYEKGYGKGFDILLDIAERLKNESIAFCIVGDDPTPEFVRIKEDKHLTNVHFIGYMDKDALSEYYAAADVFALLTRGDVWGLVINEAMMYGLPIITTDKCLAGLEMVEDNVNGYIVALDRIDYITDVILTCVRNPDLRYKMYINNIAKAEEYTFENMASSHLAVFREFATSPNG